MRRIAELDALRGLAALAIVVYHLWLINYPMLGTAVDLFFVLSGYLITGILLRNSEQGFAALGPFYARRALRIWPIYYLSLLAVVAVSLAWPSPPLAGLPLYLTYTQKITLYWSSQEPSFITAFRHTWTLAIEEQFYLIWPAVVLLCNGKRLAPICVGVAVTSFAARAFGWSPFILLARADGLACGAFLAVTLRDASRRGRPIEGKLVMATAAAICLLAVSKFGGRALIGAGKSGDVLRSFDLMMMNVAYAGLTGMVVLGAGGRNLAALRLTPLCFLGQISYGLYLYHHIVFTAVDRLGVAWWGRLGSDFLKLAVSFGLAIVSWYFVEKPILALKDRFAYARGSTPRPHVVATRGEEVPQWST
jgi:peptidoglycan/LPS O-acetylase OafA/YrhL